MADRTGSILGVFLLFSIAMFTLPILTFFIVRNMLENEYHITGFTNTAWSVISAVVVVNIIIIIYAWRAFNDAVQEEKENPPQPVEAMQKSDLDAKKDD